MSATTKLRKITRFELCERHAPWFARQTRYRKIECLNEGGPGGWTPGCHTGRCRLWPGTDYHEPSVCDREMEMEWTVSGASEDQAAEAEATLATRFTACG